MNRNPRLKNPIDPIEHYRRDIKRQVMITVWVIVAALFVLNFISVIIAVVGMFLQPDFFSNLAGMTMQDGWYEWDISESSAGLEAVLDGIDSNSNLLGLTSIISVICTLPLFLILRGKKLFRNDIFEIRNKASVSLILQIFIIAMGAQLIFGILTTGLDKILEPLGMDSTSFYIESMDMFKSPLGFMYAMLIGPICEEIIFRGAVMRSLERFGGNFAIIMSSIFFALYHIITVQAIFAFFMGLILGYVAHRYSMLWSIVIHIMINSVAIISEMLMPEIALNIFFAGFFVVGLILFIIFLKRGVIKEQRKRGKPMEVVLADGASPMIATADIASLVVNHGALGDEHNKEIRAETVKTYKPKVFRLAFSTVSFLLYFIVMLGAGILLMFNFTTLI